MFGNPAFIALSAVVASLFVARSADAVEPGKPLDGRAEAAQAIAAFTVPRGLKVELFAAEPTLRHPVAIGLDERGRVFVAEEGRFMRGTEDYRRRPYLLEDDLQTATLDDRLANWRKHAEHFDGGMAWFSKYSDQVRLVEDRDGDGAADRSTVFAGGFNEPLAGIGSGVIARDGDVYYTNIPDLWKLRDTNDDGVADERISVHRGFGVNCAYIGHDLHGLVWGPDGKLYFSVGDRGYDVTSREGRRFQQPRRGAVFRMQADGTEFEVVHVGLRNPQELAFDAYGNLFADDNNCDKGDDSRLVYVVEGGDSGWNMAFQSIEEPYLVGPWHAEKMWHAYPAAGQPAYLVPTCGKIGSGPSGFVYNGTDFLPADYREHFFMANYTGLGGVETFRVEPTGASFKVVDYRDFLKPLRATDVEFGYDGKLYVSDFGVLDWSGSGDVGRIYTLFDARRANDPRVQEVKTLFAAGFRQRATDELLALLRHADMRVRQRAQFALAERGDAVAALLTNLATSDAPLLPRLHAVWALGQIARPDNDVLAPLVKLLDDADGRLQSQTAKVFGDVGYAKANDRLVAALADSDAPTRLHAAIALGKLRHASAVGPLFDFLKSNADVDPYLRHAAVYALTLLGDADAVAARADDESPAVRLGALLVQRRLGDRRLVKFLDDAQPAIATEAARAINDLQWVDAMPALADRLGRYTSQATAESDPLLRRAVYAAYRRGTETDVRAIVDVAAAANVSDALRAEALATLADWAGPAKRDRVTGNWRPLAERSADAAERVVNERFESLVAAVAGPLQANVIRLATRLTIHFDAIKMLDLVRNVAAPVESRAAALQLLGVRRSSVVDEAAEAALADDSPRMRAEARKVLAVTQPERALMSLADVLATDGDWPERQSAVTVLGAMARPESDRLLAAWLAKVAADEAPPWLALDVLKAAEARNVPEIQEPFQRLMAELDGESDPLRKHRFSLVGGDAERGRLAFTSHRHAQCLRCHKFRGTGGDAGPDLTKVAEKNPREYLLQALVDPNAKIAPGFGSVVLALSDGTLLAGIVKEETKDKLTVVTPEGKTVVVAAADVEDRTTPVSPMPAMYPTLPRRELRDVVEFLSTLK